MRNFNESLGPVHPIKDGSGSFVWDGMTIRTYSAIHLGVAMSEHPLVNEMIRESQRFELAKAAMQGMADRLDVARESFLVADAMLAEQEKK